MSRKDGYSRRGLFGNINHYDAMAERSVRADRVCLVV